MHVIWRSFPGAGVLHVPRLVFYTSCFQGFNLTAAVQPLAAIEISAADWRRLGRPRPYGSNTENPWEGVGQSRSELYRKGGQITAIQTK
jgi:hypothetical protein